MKETILYLECASGISGDMTVAALLDLGADREVLEKSLSCLPLEGYHIEIGRRKKQGLDAASFDVVMDHKEDCHRNLQDIYGIVENARLSERVKILAKKMFLIVAEAEAKAHGTPLEQVHFHEVGAVDSIVDIVATAICLENLSINQVVVSPLSDGFGTIECAHGSLPVPVPAVLNIAAAHGLRLHQTTVQGEMVTPTGAAIAAAIQTKESLPETYRVLKVGIGAGKRDYPIANILRVMLLESNKEEQTEDIWVLESNMDDATGEMLGFCMEELLKKGARDVSYHPIYMKKNRPAWMLQVICEKSYIPKMEELIFFHTTSIGIRRYPVFRSVVERVQVLLETDYGTIPAKQCRIGDRTILYPEYESVKMMCEKTSRSFHEVYHMLYSVCEQKNSLI